MKTSSFPVTVTPQAALQLKKLLARKGQPGDFVRLGVKGGGCSGLEYLIKIEQKDLPIDLELIVEDLRIVCDQKSAKFLEGSELIWTGNLIGGGFSFENPNAERSCGCGSSFTPKGTG